jgi:hypothetical protein
MPETRHRTVLEIGVDDRALRQLAPTMERALNPKIAEAFEKSMERSTSALSKMVEQQAKLGKLLDDQAKRAQGRQRDDDKRRRDEDRRQREATRSGSAQGSFIGTMGAHVAMRTNQLAGQMPYNEGFLAQMLSAIPILGPAFSGAVGGAMGFYQSFAQQQIARARAFGTSGMTNRGFAGLTDTGVSMGYGPSEMAGMIGGLGSSSGLRGDALGRLVPRALQLQTLMGIDSGVSGSLVNASLAGTSSPGGLADPDVEDRAAAMVTEAVADGMAAGIREGRIGEVLGQIAQGVTAMRTQGIPLDLGETLGLMRGLGGLGGGFGGEASGAAARSITQGFSGAADREGVLSALAIRQRMEAHGEDYETAARAIEASPATAFRSVMSSLSRFRGTRGYETMLRNQFERLGINLSREQAHRLANAAPEDFDRMVAAELGSGESLVGGDLAAREADAPLGIAAAEAGYESRRAGIGAGMTETVGEYRGLELRMIRAFQPMVQAFAQGVIREVGGLFSAFEEGGIMGLLEHAMTRLTEAITTDLPNALREAVGLPSTADAGDMALDALDATDWALNSGLAEVMDALGADETAESMRGTADRALTRGAERRAPVPPGGEGEILPGPMVPEVVIVDRTAGGIEVAR